VIFFIILGREFLTVYQVILHCDAIKISILDEDVTVNKPECNSCYFMYVM
jgi:hypothetical protein